MSIRGQKLFIFIIPICFHLFVKTLPLRWRKKTIIKTNL